MPPFDPYLNWLGIPPHEQPPNFYRLLGVVLFESNPEVIEQAADRQSLRVGAYQAGPQGEMCQPLLSEIAMARFCLLDPQQKAAYDGQLNESLAHRGERAVAAPPPPGGSQQFNTPSPRICAAPSVFSDGSRRRTRCGLAATAREFTAIQSPAFPVPVAPAVSAASPQFSPPPAEFAPQPGMGAFHPGNGMQTPMAMPSSPPMGVPMPGPAAMPLPQQPMQMPPPAFAAATQRSANRTTMPTAARFPTPATAAVSAGAAAPPATPPAAPQRPIDELESLATQPTTRRRLLKKKKKVDHTKEVIIGVVAAGAALLLIAYIVVTSQDHSKHGFNVIAPDDPPAESVKVKLAEEHKQKLKEIEDKKAKEKKLAAARASAASANVSPLRPMGEAARRPKNRPDHVEGGTEGVAGLRSFDPPTQASESPAPGRPVESAPPAGHDTPQDLGGDYDPVMGLPKPN